MLRMSRANLAERWTLFAGAALTVCLGVALVQSSLLLLISAATFHAPASLPAADRMRIEESATAAVALLGVTMGSATFLAVFIISSTFAFTVAQRRRDLALLRLVGAGRRQVSRMLLGEAVLLGGLGAAAGIPAGLGLMAIQSWLLTTLEFVPPGFKAQWHTWILGASVGTGVLLAVAGAAVAARRAGRVRPLEALRDTGEAARVMTAGRWISGLLFTGGAVALIIVAPHGGAAGGQAMTMNVALCAAVALAVFGPLLVPAAARLLPMGGPIGMLARANLRDGRRRSASVAAPLIVLVALLLGQWGATTSFAASGVAEQRRGTAADLVLRATGPVTLSVPGIAAASTETELPVSITTGSGEDAETEITSALVIDPAAYSRVHPGTGSLAALRGATVAGGPGGDGVSTGDTVRLRLAGTDLGRLPVVAVTPAAMGGGAGLLLPPGLVPAAELAGAPSRTFVQLAPGADVAQVRAALAKVGEVRDAEAWLADDAADRNRTSVNIFLIVLGLGGLYALLGVVNSVVIAAAARRREFASARTTGLTRGQVIRAALLESSAVTTAGLLLGAVAAAATFLSVATVTSAVTGVTTLALPWTMMFAIVAGAFLVTGVTSVLTSWSATRPTPISLLAARE
jgi:putative ABC transport system permease protein